MSLKQHGLFAYFRKPEPKSSNEEISEENEDSLPGPSTMQSASNVPTKASSETGGKERNEGLPGQSTVSTKASSETEGTEGTKPKQKGVRKFNNKWLKEFNWLRYDREENIMFCHVCKQASVSSGGTFEAGRIVQGTATFKRETLVYHNKSRAHLDVVAAAKANSNPKEAPLA